MHNTDPAFRQVDLRLRLALFCLLLAAYLLIYVPVPDSADGDALLAVAAGLARHGSPDIHTMAYTDWLLPLPASRMGAFGVDGALYAKKGPTPSLLLVPFVALADALPWLTTRATAMLFNPLVTAATGMLLYSLARRLGARPRAALALGLIYGLATFAVVYVKTLFGEPLAALLLLLAVIAVDDASRTGRFAPAALAGAALAGLVGVNTIYALLAPVFAVVLLAPDGLRDRLKRLAAFALPVLVGLGLLGLFNAARFGSPFSSGYHFTEGEGFTRPILTGLYGLFLSPYRGLLWYSPVLLLALPGLFALRRRAHTLSLLTLVLVVAQALMFAGWWSWHGGIVWGPRFLIPALPLLVLWLLPVVERVLASRRALPRVGLALLIALSVGVQLLGALYSVYPYVNGYINALYWTGVFDAPLTALRDEVLTTPALSPIVGHAALAWARWPLQPAWLANGIDGVLLGAAVVVAAGGLLALRLGSRRYAAVMMVVVVAALNLTAARQRDLPHVRAAETFAAAVQPPGMVVAATTLYESALVDVEGGARIITLNAPTAPDDPWARRLWRFAWDHGERLWLVSWFPPADPLNWPERDLWARAAFAGEQTLPGHRALWFDVRPGPAADRGGGWRFETVLLDGYGVRVDRDGVRVRLDWRAETAPGEDLSWFVHLLDAGGQIVAQQDRAPQGGYRPTGGWRRGTRVTDRLLLPLAPGTDTDGWALRVGWVRPPEGERLAAFAPDGTPLGDGFVLLPLPAPTPAAP